MDQALPDQAISCMEEASLIWRNHNKEVLCDMSEQMIEEQRLIALHALLDTLRDPWLEQSHAMLSNLCIMQDCEIICADKFS